MAGRSNPIPSIRHQPLSVDFIDNHLQEYHEAFKNPQVRYDPELRRYVATTPRQPSAKLTKEHVPQARKLQPAVEAMRFWTFIFEDAMKRFMLKYKDEPDHRIKEDDYNIRNKKNWQDIYAQLQKARESYDGQEGFWGRVKKGLRKAADNSDTAKQVIRLVPDNEYVSPVLAVVEVLVDVSSHRIFMPRQNL
jgi:cell division protein YceG involved in septum cleavage